MITFNHQSLHFCLTLFLALALRVDSLITGPAPTTNVKLCITSCCLVNNANMVDSIQNTSELFTKLYGINAFCTALLKGTALPV